MRTVAGELYRVSLALDNAELQSPTWLVGALSQRYTVEVAAVEAYNEALAVVLLRWRKIEGEINEGDFISGSVEGLLVPAELLPSGVVTEVESVAVARQPSALLIEAVEQLPEWQSNAIKITTAATIMATVWYLSSRIRRNNAELGAAQPEAA